MEIFDIVADVGSTRNIAGERPDLVKDFARVFQEARADSEWYINPGETKAQIAAKRKRAADAGQMIERVLPNHSSR